ncbi:MAG: hypothetical protein JWP57_1960 [Spirosoma sp.]|nr:hypothetical protein [Spirosoma sp.]
MQVAAVTVALVKSVDRNVLQSSYPFKSDLEAPATDIWVIDLPTPS